MKYLHSCYKLCPECILQTLEQQKECSYLTSDCFIIGGIAARFCCMSKLKDSGNTNMKHTLSHICYKTIYSRPVSPFIFQFEFPFIFILLFFCFISPKSPLTLSKGEIQVLWCSSPTILLVCQKISEVRKFSLELTLCL